MLIQSPAHAQAATTITIAYNNPNFTGTVSSTSPSCVAGRTVNIRQVQGSTSTIIATGATNASGNYTIPFPNAHGSFFAEAPAVFAGGGGGYGSAPTMVCQAGQSPTITVGPSPTPTVSPTATATPQVQAASQITLGHDGTRFFGQVTSDDPSCVAGRTVHIFRETTSGDSLIATVTTGQNGMYQRLAPRADGPFHAVVTGETRGNVTCLAAQSETNEVERPRACRGRSGPNVISGTNGNDLIAGGSQAEFICGRGGDDTIGGDSGSDHIFGGSGDDLMRGRGGDDRVVGGSGADTLKGNSGDDTLIGGSGDDILQGGNGHDRLFGGRGVDAARGHNGNDLLDGGPAPDACIPGSGNNTVVRCG